MWCQSGFSVAPKPQACLDSSMNVWSWWIFQIALQLVSLLQPPLTLCLTCLCRTRASPGRPNLTKSLFKISRVPCGLQDRGSYFQALAQATSQWVSSFSLKAALPVPYCINPSAGSYRCQGAGSYGMSSGEFWYSQPSLYNPQILTESDWVGRVTPHRRQPESAVTLLEQEAMPMVLKTHSLRFLDPLNINATGVLGVWCLFYVSVHRVPMPEKLG